MVLVTIVNGTYKTTYNWGAPHCMLAFRSVMVDFKGEQQNLVGGLEHEFYFQSYMGISSSQLTNSIIFQRGSSHQPDKIWEIIPKWPQDSG